MSQARGTSSSHHGTNQNCPTPRILRCFCNCTELTWDEVKLYSNMNIADLVDHPKAKKLFITFLKLGHRSDRSGALTALECYDLCHRLIDDRFSRSEDAYDELRELCPNYKWEQRLDDAIERENSGEDSEALDKYLRSLQFKVKRNIESHRDYGRFQDELIQKLKQ